MNKPTLPPLGVTHFNSARWTRRQLLGCAASGAALLAAGCASVPQAVPEAAGASAAPDPWLDQAHALLRRHSSVDIHSHPGRFFLKDAPALDASLAPMMSTIIPRTLAGMKSGQVSAAVFSVVSDLRALSAIPGGMLMGNLSLAAGDAYVDHHRQVRVFRELVSSGQVHAVLSAPDIDRARKLATPGGLLATEGADFLEGRLDRLDEAHRDGIRLIGLVHYRRNELGDPQTNPSDVSGLTAFGEQVVRRMNQMGLLIDLAHISRPAVRRAVELSTAPMLLSHVMVAKPGINNLRVLAAEDVRLVTNAGGLIGAWPAGIGLGQFNDYIDEIARLVDLFGVDHVAIGTDMDANFKPVFGDYSQFPRIPAALLERGMRPREVAQIVGGNFMRVFSKVCAGRCAA